MRASRMELSEDMVSEIDRILDGVTRFE